MRFVIPGDFHRNYIPTIINLKVNVMYAFTVCERVKHVCDACVHYLGAIKKVDLVAEMRRDVCYMRSRTNYTWCSWSAGGLSYFGCDVSAFLRATPSRVPVCGKVCHSLKL